MDVRLLFLSKTNPLAEGGAELRTWKLAEQFAQWGAQVKILTTETSESTGRAEVVKGVEFEYLRPTSFAKSSSDRVAFLAPRIQFFLSRQPIFQRLLREEETDLVHEDITPFPTLYANKLCERRHIPQIATIHQLRGSLHSWIRNYGILGVGGSLGELALRRSYVRYSHIITDSLWMRESLIQDLPSEMVSWIPNGVDTSLFQPAAEDRPQSDAPRLAFLCVGRFLGWKGHRTLLRSFDQCLKRGVRARLNLIGTGPEFQSIRAFSEQLGLTGDVSFHGHIPHDEMPAIYQEADIFVLPSTGTEGLSVALLEAMSSGLPIIASDVIGNRSVLDDSMAILVPARNEKEMSDAMERLSVDDALRKELGRAARKKAVEMFSWKRVAQKELELFLTYIEELGA